jgi:hypothetical protein
MQEGWIVMEVRVGNSGKMRERVKGLDSLDWLDWRKSGIGSKSRREGARPLPMRQRAGLAESLSWLVSLYPVGKAYLI